ncbi:winged helix-turn-helix domain-containing protein [Croceicoccus bisphenolivorans]|uniref:winged helix-turn-helix domain-containing protein n=1 Tax=Croceicoccus bisphenolivorans TaxID=1783232 RepID=UPI00083486ED|nr:winged helix-turn-helix domain-containing protein [Croceicoccus bisphenolivorans]
MDAQRSPLLTVRDLAERPPFAIGSLTISPATRVVRGPSGEVSVEPRVMQVLIALADAAGAVVTRDTLMDRCWGNVFVGDDSLNRAIAGVRRIPERVGSEAYSVATVSGTGYRLVANDVPHSPIAGKAAGHAASQLSKPVTRRALIGGGAVVVAGAGAAYLWQGRLHEADPVERLIDESRIAMRAGTPEGGKRAVMLLDRAVALEPRNADAWGLLALTIARIDEHALGTTSYPVSRVDEAASRAIRLDEDNADAAAARAIAIPYFGDWLEAEQRFDKVLSDHPDHLETQDSRAFLLATAGRITESANARLAMNNDLFDPEMQYRMVYGLWFLGQIEEADRVASRGISMWPGHAGLWFARLWVMTGTGRFERALAHVDDEASRPALPPPMFETIRAAILAASDPGSDRAQVVARVMASVTQNVAAVVNAFMLLNLMGEVDRAFDLADAYYLEKGPIIAAVSWRPGQPVVQDQRRRKTNMIFTPTAEPMQRDPRFMPLMAKIGLADYWKRKGVVPDFLASAGRA